MCGFVGIWAHNGHVVDVAALACATNALRHRGPDDEGYYLYSRDSHHRHCAGPDSDPRLRLPPLSEVVHERYELALGFRRLSILDLSPAGHQPMSTADGRFWIVYNGEVYNYTELREELKHWGYRFGSDTDTEVVLAAYLRWGKQCVEHFNGMWAFAIWDSQTQTLFLSRDRFGIKPLYYTWAEGSSFIFASEIKAILAAQRVWVSPSPLRVAAYLALGKHPREMYGETFFDHIHAVPPSSCLVVQGGRLQQFCYWQIPAPTNTGASPDELVERYRVLLTNAVRRHLRSDVPVGSCLSGGLDSTAITLLMNRLLNEGNDNGKPRTSSQKTFSAAYSFAGPWNEIKFINAFLKMVAVDAHFAYPDHERLLRDLEDLIWYHEQPFHSLSIFAQWCVMSEANSHGVKVLLDGQGGDEILAGYNPFPAAIRCSLLSGRFRELFTLLQSLRRKKYPALIQTAFNEFVCALSQTLKTLLGMQSVPRLASIQRSAKRAGLTKDLTALLVKERNVFRYPTFTSLHELLQNWVRGNLVLLLRYEDRNSMRWSIESRVPYLDQQLVEFLFGVHHQMWIGQGWTKWLHRQAFRDALPPEIVWRKDKVGFEAPDHSLMQPNIAHFEPLFCNDVVRQYMDGKTVTRIQNILTTSSPNRKDLRLAWRLINLAAWLEIMPKRIQENRLISILSS